MQLWCLLEFPFGTARATPCVAGVAQIEDVQQSQVGWLFSRGGAVEGRRTELALGVASVLAVCSAACVWLFAGTAFDKTDLLYLRDEEEKRRHLEDELRDSEKGAFRAAANQDGGEGGSGSVCCRGAAGTDEKERQGERAFCCRRLSVPAGLTGVRLVTQDTQHSCWRACSG